VVQRAVNPLKMNPALKDPQLQKQITIWRKCEPLCGQTVDSVQMITSELHLNHTTVHQILTQELTMRKLCAKIVPKNLTIKQKDNRKDVGLHLLERIQSDRNFLKNVITGDVTWIFEYDPETKRQSKEWHTSASPCPKKARMSKSKIKSMLIWFLTVKGLSILNLCLKATLLISFTTVIFLKD